jgi:hypothetical protein
MKKIPFTGKEIPFTGISLDMATTPTEGTPNLGKKLAASQSRSQRKSN